MVLPKRTEGNRPESLGRLPILSVQYPSWLVHGTTLSPAFFCPTNGGNLSGRQLYMEQYAEMAGAAWLCRSQTARSPLVNSTKWVGEECTRIYQESSMEFDAHA
jgi:hypothetical protein